MIGFDLFTQEGYPWARFFLSQRKPSVRRQGSMQSCACGRTFVRTDPDPQALQVCQVCDHDRRETTTAPAIVVPITRKRSRRS